MVTVVYRRDGCVLLQRRSSCASEPATYTRSICVSASRERGRVVEDGPSNRLSIEGAEHARTRDFLSKVL